MRPKPKPKRLVLILALILTVAAMSTVGIASGLAQTPTLDGDNVIEYDNDGEIKNGTRTLVQGTPYEDGCRFVVEVSLAPGQTAVGGREVSHDPDTCKSIFEVGEPVSTSDDGGEEVPAPGDGARGGNVGSRYVGASSTTHSKGYFKAWAEDPINLDVNRVTSYMDWYWNGTCVTQANLNAPKLWWLKTSGWKKRSGIWRSKGSSCSKAYNEAKAHFDNSQFCEFITGGLEGEPTHVHYESVYITGFGSGNLTGSVDFRKYGGCNNFLSLEYDLERTKN